MYDIYYSVAKVFKHLSQNIFYVDIYTLCVLNQYYQNDKNYH